MNPTRLDTITSDDMDEAIRSAEPEDLDAIVSLLPRLAAFEVPNGRTPEELWHDDRRLVEAWARGERDDVHVRVSVDGQGVRGVAVISQRKELLSGEPSAHLEILALDERAEGQGLATALIADSERLAVESGACSMSLHVFANNARARRLYERAGFDGELLRYFKRLPANGSR